MKHNNILNDLKKQLAIDETSLLGYSAKLTRDAIREIEMLRDCYRVFLDGDMWCATAPGFVDLQESKAEFGETPTIALDNLIEALEKARYP